MHQSAKNEDTVYNGAYTGRGEKKGKTVVNEQGAAISRRIGWADKEKFNT